MGGVLLNGCTGLGYWNVGGGHRIALKFQLDRSDSFGGPIHGPHSRCVLWIRAASGSHMATECGFSELKRAVCVKSMQDSETAPDNANEFKPSVTTTSR